MEFLIRNGVQSAKNCLVSIDQLDLIKFKDFVLQMPPQKVKMQVTDEREDFTKTQISDKGLMFSIFKVLSKSIIKTPSAQ